jgi:hypothetical protein
MKLRNAKRSKKKGIKTSTDNIVNSNLLSNISNKKISEEFTDDDVFD